MSELNPKRFDRGLLAELLEGRILCFYKWIDCGKKGEYLGLTPWARREILQLSPSQGLAALGLSKMTKNDARKGFESGPKGHHVPASDEAKISIEEGDR